MRTFTALLPSLLLTLAMPIVAQTAPSNASSAAGSNWQRVQTLPPNASLYVTANKKTASCHLKSVDAETLTCTHGKDTTFQRTEITAVKLQHHGRSTLIATGVGGGTGAIIGFAVGTRGNDNSFFGKNFLRGAVTAVGAVAGGVIGAPIGYLTDLNRSTIYKTTP